MRWKSRFDRCATKFPTGASFAKSSRTGPCGAPVEPSAKLELDNELLARFPEGYRHLAYLQTRIGYKVKPDMPGIEGEEFDRSYARDGNWLAGKPL